jgi:insertion element IS1 protein InsB
MWIFVQKQDNKQWLWLALCRRTRQIVGYYIGDRGIKACKQFRSNIAPGYQNLITKSDGCGVKSMLTIPSHN